MLGRKLKVVDIKYILVYVGVANLSLISDLTAKCLDLEKRVASGQSSASSSTVSTVEFDSTRRDLEAANKKVDELESKQKVVQGDADCQRHNAETIKSQLEKRLREREVELQKNLDTVKEESAALRRKIEGLEDTLRKKEAAAKESVKKLEDEKW